MDFDTIKQLIKVFKDSGLSKISIKEKDFEVSLEGEKNYHENSTFPLQEMKEIADINLENTINAPMVGTFYRSVAPDKPPFVEPGDTIKKGDTLCIIEAMKVMNEIKADCDGKIKTVMLQDGALVEFAKPLFVME